MGVPGVCAREPEGVKSVVGLPAGGEINLSDLSVRRARVYASHLLCKLHMINNCLLPEMCLAGEVTSTGYTPSVQGNFLNDLLVSVFTT